jgi:hypothetical protein
MQGSDDNPFSTGAGLGVFLDLTHDDQEALIGRELDGYRRIEDIDAPHLTRGLPSLMDTSSGEWPLNVKSGGVYERECSVCRD